MSGDFIPADTPAWPPGLLYVEDFLSGEEEQSLLAFTRTLSFNEFVMRGVTAKRRVVYYGWSYSYSRTRGGPAPPIPDEFAVLRERIGFVARQPAGDFVQVLVNGYGLGAGMVGIGTPRLSGSSREYRSEVPAVCAFAAHPTIGPW